jgi:hypothetical protein
METTDCDPAAVVGMLDVLLPLQAAIASAATSGAASLNDAFTNAPSQEICLVG